MKSTAELSLGRSVRPKRLELGHRKSLLEDSRPLHVRHCFKGTGSRKWSIWTWRKASPRAKIRVPYQCNSWRCDACAPHEAHVLWSRIRQACEGLDPRGFVFFVLTLDQLGHYDRRAYNWRKWHDAREAFRDLSRMQQSLLNRLRYHAKRHGWGKVGSRWVSVVEQHRSGWPHMNVLLYCPELAAELEREQSERAARGIVGRGLLLVDGELREMVTASGWGRQSTAERARSADALANYVTKVAGHGDQTANELAKVTQAPRSAPARFRRLRSGKNFLPAREGKNPEWTGSLLRRQLFDGSPIVLPVHRGAPEFLGEVERACCAEEKTWFEELETIGRNRKMVERHGPQSVLGPVVTHWYDGERSDRGPPEEPSLLFLRDRPQNERRHQCRN